MSAAGTKLDFLLYGATGFTGQTVALELASQLPTCTWAIGGRNAGRLAAVASSITAAYPNAQAPLVAVADAERDSRDALRESIGCARIVLNCAGPFASLGGRVVRACIDAGVDYVDISGEPSFILGTMLEEHGRACGKGSLVVSACGFDSIPAEIGCLYTAEALEMPGGGGEAVTHIESYMRLLAEDAKVGAHVTTLECLLMGFKTADRTRKIRRGLENRHPLPKRECQPKVEKGVFKFASAYCTLFPGSDSSIVRESLRAVDEGLSNAGPQSRFHSYSAYFVVGGAWKLFWVAIFGAMLFIVSKLGGDGLILRYPHLFTNNAFSRAGPSPSDRAATMMQLDFYGKRFVDSKLTSEVVTRVSVVDPGYAGTARILVACARTMLDERSKLPSGGVLAPGAVFAGTSLMKRLEDTNALRMEVLPTTQV